MAATKLNLRNVAINGSMEYFQRNTTFAAVADSTYTADRWMYRKTGTMVHTVSRSTDVPSSAFGIYSLLTDCTTAQASIGTNDNVIISQRIEGNMFRSLKGKKIVLSFWVKATKAGVYCISFRNATDTRSLIKEYTISAANTWEKKIIRIQHDITGAWDYTTGIGLKLGFVLACGSGLRSTPDSWLNGNFIATSNQVNACDAVANDFWLTDVCLVEDNEGQTREPDFVLAGRDVFEELQLCQRYFEIITNFIMRSYAHGGGYAKLVPKRSSPIISESSIVNNNTGGPSRIAVDFSGITYSFSAITTNETSTRFTITADAEL